VSRRAVWLRAFALIHLACIGVVATLAMETRLASSTPAAIGMLPIVLSYGAGDRV
jgi:hypothetical protein